MSCVNMEPDEKKSNIKRRSVIKNVSAGVGSISLAGQSAASPSSQGLEITNEKAQINADELSFKSQIGQADKAVTGLIENLSTGGHIDSPSVGALGYKEVVASRGISQNMISAHTATFGDKEFLVYETRISTDEFDSDIHVSIMPERGKAGATAIQDGERYVLSAEYDGFVRESSDEVSSYEQCSDCKCGVYCTTAYDDSKYCESQYGLIKKCCNCSPNWL